MGSEMCIRDSYFGFQIQQKKNKSEITVQSVLEKALKDLFKENIRIAASGRTDRGVHAKAQVVNFKVETKIPLNNIKKALNSFLPSDIRIRKIKKVPLGFHARFSAKSKVYRYIILNSKEFSVFSKDFTWQLDSNLDLGRMKKAAKKLVGRKDFSVFAKQASAYKDCHRFLRNISIRKSKNHILIDMEAEGFLRCMARNIVSFLVKVGECKIKPADTLAILKKKTPYINKPAPASGLYLYKVKY